MATVTPWCHRYTTVGGIPVTEMIDADKLDAIVERTKKEEVRLSTSWARQPGMHRCGRGPNGGSHRARPAPRLPLLRMVARRVRRQRPVPRRSRDLGKNGIEKIIELDLNDDEKELLRTSEAAVRDVKGVLDRLSL